MVHNEEKFLALINRVPNIAIRGINRKREVVYWNKGCEDIYGYKAEEVIGKKIEDVIFPEIIKNEIIKKIDRWFKSGVTQDLPETPLVKKDGTSAYVFSSYEMIEDDNQHIQEMFCVDVDLSQIKEQEKKIKEQEELIYHQSKMASMGEMLENIAHQWRQPLSVISTVASGVILKKEYSDLDDEEFTESMQSIIRTSSHLSKTIDDFRDFFKPNKERDSFSIEHAFKKTFDIVSPRFKNKHIELHTDIEDVEVYGLENELIQSLMVIFNNASDAFEDKEKIDEKHIFVNTHCQNNRLTISIKDNAGGIEKNILNKIFEPYFTTKHQSDGTGIGLFMTQEMITKHMNGKIYANNCEYVYENQEYHGAQFCIELPIDGQSLLNDEILKEFEKYNCYRWDKSKEIFERISDCNEAVILKHISEMSKLFNYYEIGYEIMDNYDIKVFF